MRNGLKAAVVATTVAVLGTAGLTQTSHAYDSNDNYRHHTGHGKYYKHHGGKHRNRHWSHNGHGFKKLMERFDSNNDNELTQDELNEARKTLLTKHDSDKNGQLSLDEFKMLWLEFMHKKMVRSFQHLDQDGNATITVEEFVEPFSETVARMDRNGDGTLNKQDRRHRTGDDSTEDEPQDEQ